MAEQDLKQVMLDAIVDADSLEQFINGLDSETVLTRLSAEYPTLQKAIKQMFENGGLPATPFKTESLMTASDLIDGDYALVTDDTDDKNGIYIKESGLWIKSNYSPTSLAKAEGADAAASLMKLLADISNVEPAHTYNKVVINASEDPGRSVLSAEAPDRQSKFYNVSELNDVLITGANDMPSDPDIEWRWTFLNEAQNTRILVSDFSGSGVLKVPDNAYWLARTTRLGDTVDDNFTVYGVRGTAYIPDIESRLEGKVNTLNETKELSVEVIQGSSINGDARYQHVLSPGSDRSYFKIDVSELGYIIVSNSNYSARAFWVFATSEEPNKRLSYGNIIGNGILEIPEGAKWAYRDWHVPNWQENENLKLEGVYTYPKRQDLSKLRDIQKSLDKDNGSYEYAQKLIAESGMMLVKISDFEGANSHEKIDNAISFIKASGQGILDLESGVHVRNSAILMPSNCWLYLNDSHLKLADGVHDNLIRNEGIVPDLDPFKTAVELNENRNIRIFGNGKDRSTVTGPDMPYTAPHPIDGGDPIPWVGDFYGWRTLEINLANVKDYAIHGFSMANARCWAITQQHGCEDFQIHDIDFDTHVKNGDGVDVLMGCKRGEIYNITGHTGDDTVALSALQNFVTSNPQGNYIYPMMVGGWADRGLGTDISDINIRDIKASGDHNGVRILASGSSKVHHIYISNIGDTSLGYRYYLLLISSGYGEIASEGDISNIYANHVESLNSGTALYIRDTIIDSHINNVIQHNPSKALVDNLAIHKNLEITNARFVN